MRWSNRLLTLPGILKHSVDGSDHLAFDSRGDLIDLVDRRMAETFGYSRDEIDALTEVEKLPGPPTFASEFKRSYSTDFESGNREAASETEYWTHGGAPSAVVVDDNISRPEFVVNIDPATGRVVAELSPMLAGHVPYFEFDVSPNFDSAKVFRVPPLATFNSGHNLVSPRGSRLMLRNTTKRGYVAAPRFELPVRPHCLFLKLPDERPSFAHFAKMAELLTYGLEQEPERQLEEIYNYALHHVLWGDDRYMKSGYELFSAGVGGCGSVNNMVGEMLEMMGFRYRMVSGFNPVVRKAYPGGGHSAIEVLIDDKWTFVDAFLDVTSYGYSAETISRSPEHADIHVFFIDNAAFPEAEYGKSMTLGRLFRYRMYSDLGGRNITYTMVNLGSKTDGYGRAWPLRPLLPSERVDYEEDIQPEIELNIRGRFIRSDEPVLPGGNPRFPMDAKAGPWVSKSIILKAENFFLSDD